MGARAAARSDTGIDIPLPPDFDVDWTLAFLDARHAPSLEIVAPALYMRTFVAGGRPLTVKLWFDGRPPRGRRLRARSSPRVTPDTLIALATALFDLDADIAAFRRHVRHDRILGALVAQRPGIRLPRMLDPFEGAARAILGQQISVAAARRIVERLVAALGARGPQLDGRSLRLFPTPERVLRAGAGRLGAIGLTRGKQAALLAVADQMRSGRLDWTALGELPPDAAQARLEQIRGIGPWTAAYLRMRVLGDRDAFPATDLGVVHAFSALAGRRRPSTGAIAAAAAAWRPWRAYATLHLWRSLGGA